jgi:hypothetical protein
MGPASEGLGAIGESVVFLDLFNDLPDPRQRGKIIYPLAEVLLLLLAVLGGAETFVDIARFGEKKIDLLRRFRPFRDGTPSHDHLGDIFATLDAGAFQRCFVSWAAALTGAPADVIAIDGKTLRRSYQKKGAKLRDRSRSVKLRVLDIARAARSKAKQSQEKLKRAYGQLLNSTSRVVGQAKRSAEAH